MLRNILFTSTATVLATLIAQGAPTPASAKGIKVPSVKVHVAPKVKIKPRINIATPRIRVKVKTDRLAKKATEEVRQDKVAPETRTPVAVLTPASAAPPFEIILPPRPKPQINRLAEIDPEIFADAAVEPEDADEFSRIKDVMDAATELEELLDLARLGGGINLDDTFGLNQADASPEDGIGESDGTNLPGSLGDNNGLGDARWGAGAESGIFGFIPGTNGTAPDNANHGSTADAAKNALGVTADTIAGAMAGVAGRKTYPSARLSDTGWRNMGGDITRNSDGSTVSSSVHQHRTVVKVDENGIHEGNLHRDVAPPQNVDPEVVPVTPVPAGSPMPVTPVPVGGSGEETQSGSGLGSIADVVEGSGIEPPGTGAAGSSLGSSSDIIRGGVQKLRDPDSAGGGSSPFPWVNDHASQSPPRVVGSMSEVLPPDPGQGQVVQQAPRQALVTQDDVLTTYDEDSRMDGRRGQMTWSIGPGPMPQDPNGN